MWRRIRRWLASLLVFGALAMPVSAQADPAPGQDKSEERAPPALAYALFFAAILTVLVIICVPSRKR